MNLHSGSIIDKYQDSLEKEADWARQIRQGEVDGPTVRSALRIFGVSRNFPGIAGNEDRIAAITSEAIVESRRLLEMDGLPDRVVFRQVDKLAETFAQVTGRLSLSAASKLLWLGCGFPFVVYDQRARQALASLQDRSRPRTDYCAFHMDWQEELDKVSDRIDTKPPARLVNWTALMADPQTPSCDFAARVFDKYLWDRGA